MKKVMLGNCGCCCWAFAALMDSKTAAAIAARRTERVMVSPWARGRGPGRRKCRTPQQTRPTHNCVGKRKRPGVLTPGRSTHPTFELRGLLRGLQSDHVRARRRIRPLLQAVPDHVPDLTQPQHVQVVAQYGDQRFERVAAIQ